MNKNTWELKLVSHCALNKAILIFVFECVIYAQKNVIINEFYVLQYSCTYIITYVEWKTCTDGTFLHTRRDKKPVSTLEVWEIVTLSIFKVTKADKKGLFTKIVSFHTKLRENKSDDYFLRYFNFPKKLLKISSNDDIASSYDDICRDTIKLCGC